MTTITYELYEAFKELGLDEKKAKATAQAVVGRAEAKEFATKADIGKLEMMMKYHSALLIGIFILLLGQYLIK